MRYVAGIDIGTSGAKTVLIDENGRVICSKTEGYRIHQPENGWAEQDPKDWKAAALSTLKSVIERSGVDREAVTGIGISGQMHGLVLLDDMGDPLGRSIIWCDQRSEAETKEMLALLPLEDWIDITANPPVAAWTAAKILWVQKHQPERWKSCRHILLPKDYIRFVLTGEYAAEASDASGMQLLEVKNRRWSHEVLKRLKIKKDMLGALYESQEVTGTLLPEIAAACGLTPSVRVVAGAADNAAAAIGTGTVSDGEALTTIGTSAILYTHLDRYVQIPDGGLHVCCSAVPGCWFTMGGPQAAGLSLEWFKDNFCREYVRKAREEGGDVYSILNDEAERVPAGSGRLIYLPFLMGERTPHLDPKYRGAFVGLNTIHTKAHLLRAIMEGVGYSLADCNDILKKMGKRGSVMRFCGGGSKSPVWLKIMAALYECEIHTLKQEEGAAYGAAILAGVGTGLFPDILTACRRLIETKEVIKPDGAEVLTYRKYHLLFNRLYDHIKDDFQLLYEMG